jgi:hypothetical protein
MARVVRPGGWIIVADHVTDPDGEAAAWHGEIERLRDPSHWACLTPGRLRSIGEQAGLALVREQSIPLRIDFDEWLIRGSGGPAAAALIERLLTNAPRRRRAFASCWRGTLAGFELRYQFLRWRRI